MTEELHMHYVATHDESKAIIESHEKFWVMKCGCRESKGICGRSHHDVCLMFSPSSPENELGAWAITHVEVEEILSEAEEKRLVARPFRNTDFTETEGVCFCCDDCCGYFLDEEEICDKGKYIESTDFEVCNDCGICIDKCYFGARMLNSTKFEVEQEKCYGCGLCVQSCPIGAITMVSR